MVIQVGHDWGEVIRKVTQAAHSPVRGIVLCGKSTQVLALMALWAELRNRKALPVRG